jgi:SAM-dependent methyltransferase
MGPRLAIIAYYIRTLGARSVLDVGCGNGLMCEFLCPSVAYSGIDVSATAIQRAKERFSGLSGAKFVEADFRYWPTNQTFDAVVWAGLGLGCGRLGGANFSDWEDIIERMSNAVSVDGVIILELIEPYLKHIPRCVSSLQSLIGCDLVCYGTRTHARRCIRVFRPRK